MLFASPLSVNHSFAESQENQEEKGKISKNVKKERFWVILTEIVDRKLKLQHYGLTIDISDEVIGKILSFEDQISSWTYANYNAYHSGMSYLMEKHQKLEKIYGKLL